MNEGDRTALSAVKSVFHAAREYLNPLLKESKFKETGGKVRRRLRLLQRTPSPTAKSISIWSNIEN